MNIGMLWFDNDPKAEMNTKIARAGDYYQHKYGKSPNLCFVHPSMLLNGTGQPAEKGIGPDDIEIRILAFGDAQSFLDWRKRQSHPD